MMRLEGRWIDNETAVLIVDGELDRDGATQLTREAEHGQARNVRWLVLDLTDMAFLDSTGLASLLFLWNEMRARGGALTLVLPPGADARRTLEIRGVADRLRIVATRDDALAREPRPQPS